MDYLEVRHQLNEILDKGEILDLELIIKGRWKRAAMMEDGAGQAMQATVKLLCYWFMCERRARYRTHKKRKPGCCRVRTF